MSDYNNNESSNTYGSSDRSRGDQYGSGSDNTRSSGYGDDNTRSSGYGDDTSRSENTGYGSNTRSENTGYGDNSRSENTGYGGNTRSENTGYGNDNTSSGYGDSSRSENTRSGYDNSSSDYTSRDNTSSGYGNDRNDRDERSGGTYTSNRSSSGEVDPTAPVGSDNYYNEAIEKDKNPDAFREQYEPSTKAKIQGGFEKVLGKVTGDPDKVEHGDALKGGYADDRDNRAETV